MLFRWAGTLEAAQRRTNPCSLRLIPARIPGRPAGPPLEGARELARDVGAGLLVAVKNAPQHHMGHPGFGGERPDRRGAANRLPEGGL